MAQIKEKSGKVTKIGNLLSVLVGIIAFVVAWLVDGWAWWSFLTVPLFFLGLFTSLIGVIPFFGPLFYFFGVGWLFDIIIRACGLTPGIGSALIFYFYFGYSIVFCFISTLVFVLAIALQKKAEDIFKRRKKNEES